MNPNKLPQHLTDISSDPGTPSQTRTSRLEDTLEQAGAYAQERDIIDVATLELLEERATVQAVREVVGQLEVRREIVRRIEHIPVELVTETVVIEHSGLTGHARSSEVAFTLEVNGERMTLEPGQHYSFEIYRERAEVSTLAEVVEVVKIGKRNITETQTVSVELGREQLVLEQDSHLVASEEDLIRVRQDGL